MHSRLCKAAVLAVALCGARGLHAADSAELAEIRAEIRQLKQRYEARIGALEARLRDAEAAVKAATSAPAVNSAVPTTANGAAPTTAVSAAPPVANGVAPAVANAPMPAAITDAVPAAATPASGIAAFNPAVSVVLQGRYANLSQDPSRSALAGFAQADDIGPGRRGLSLGESEVTFSANVDDRFAGNLTVALTPENTVSVEEAYGYLPSLGNGLVPKFGRFFSGIGYQNEQHQHVWDFVDAPLAYQAFLGGQLAQDGVQVKWVAPTDLFVELGAEIGNGDVFPGGERNRNGIGMASVFAHVGGDVGASHSWRAGLSFLATRPRDRVARQLATTGDFTDVAFDGQSRLTVADFVWKYAPNGNARDTSVKVQGEYFWRRERGTLVSDPGESRGPALGDPYRGRGSGGYLQAVWQFRPAWRVGARFDHLSPGRSDDGANADLLDLDFSPRRVSAMLDYTPSEFSRFRLQYADSRTRPGETDHQVFLQYILTLGAHGAHRF